MFTSIIALLGGAVKAVASYFGWAQQRDAEKNTAPIRQAADSKQEQQQLDSIQQDVAKGNIDEIRKDLAE